VPSAFARRAYPDGSPAAFSSACRGYLVAAGLLAADTSGRHLREHLAPTRYRRRPQVLFLRHMLAAVLRRRNAPAHASLIPRSSSAALLADRPRLRRIYFLLAGRDPAAALSIRAVSAFPPVSGGSPTAAANRGTTYHARLQRLRTVLHRRLAWDRLARGNAHRQTTPCSIPTAARLVLDGTPR